MAKVRVFEVVVERVRKPWPLGQKFRVRIVGANGETLLTGETLANHIDAASTAALIALGDGTIRDTTGLGAAPA